MIFYVYNYIHREAFEQILVNLSLHHKLIFEDKQKCMDCFEQIYERVRRTPTGSAGGACPEASDPIQSCGEKV
jgi:hypothetical protein